MAVSKVSLGRQTDLNANSNKITNVTDPTTAQDAATKAYVDTLVQGAKWKDAVRVATTANGTLASAFANGSTIDTTVTLVTGDRILIKDQTTGAENGIYTVNASGAPTRALDADASGEIGGMAVRVREGTANGDTGWVLTNDGTVTLGTTALVFVNFIGVGGVTAGAGVTLTGSTIDVISGNGGIVVSADAITLTAADASVAIGAGGIKVASGTAGQINLSNGSGVVTPTSLSGDVASVSGTGSVTLATGVMRTSGFVDRETPTGAVNGANTAFTLANTPIAGSEHVYLNGLIQEPGAGNDYTISGTTITYLTAPLTGDKIRTSYRK